MQYALAVGAAAAAVGIVVGVINTTGVGFRLGFMVTNGAAQIAENLVLFTSWIPGEAFSQSSMQLFLSLCFIAMACILMAPVYRQRRSTSCLHRSRNPHWPNSGSRRSRAICSSSTMALSPRSRRPYARLPTRLPASQGRNPFRTGISAFTLGVGKLMVPMVFVYAPTMLIVLPEHFTMGSFLQVSFTCAFGIFLIATAVAGYALVRMYWPLRLLATIAGLFLVAPSLTSDLIGVGLAIPLIALQVLASRNAAPASAPAQ